MILLLLNAIAYTAGIATGAKSRCKLYSKNSKNQIPVIFPKSKNGDTVVLSPEDYCKRVSQCDNYKNEK